MKNSERTALVAGPFSGARRPNRELQTALRLTRDEAATLDRLARVLKLPDRSAVLRAGLDALIRSLPAETRAKSRVEVAPLSRRDDAAEARRADDIIGRAISDEAAEAARGPEGGGE
jgi:hypothetical protein